MADEAFNISLAEIAGYDWEAVFTQADHPSCSEYSTLLFQKAGQLAKEGDAKGERVFRFLAAIASLAVRSGDKDSPLVPSIVMENRRSCAMEDFSAADFDVISGLLSTARDTAMRARLGDVLWVGRKDHKAAKVATDAYLENVKAFDVEKDWIWGMESLRRGFSLARLLGKKNESFRSYVTHVESIISARAASETEALSAHLMDLLLEYEEGDFSAHAATAEPIAKSIEARGNYFLAQRYLELAMRFHVAAKNEEAARQARLNKGECLVRQAQVVINQPGQGYATGAHFLAMGIECLRQAQAPEQTVEALHKQLRDWQEKAVDEMQGFPFETDISQATEAARNLVRGKTLLDAVLAFVFSHSLVKPSELRERVIKNAGQFPLSHLMGATFMSHDGRVLAHKPPVISLGKDVDEVALEAEMFSQARTVDWPLRVSAYIEPCRFEIFQEHRPSLRDLAFLVEHNPFIPPGHEALFLRGIHAGFHGDMVLCAHVLVPQIEEAIRYVLRRSGVVTSKLDSKLVQEERLLGVLLAMPETIQIFGEECVFELRGVLVEKFGFDLRNRLAHGFVTQRECFAPDVALMWWLILRLCSFPVVRKLSKDAESQSPEKEGMDSTQSGATSPA